MDKNKICEAMYALPGSVVVRRRKPFLIPALVLTAGVALIVLNNIYGASVSANLRSSAVFVGGLLAVGGVVAVAARFFGSGGVPFHRSHKCYLRYEEIYFDRKASREVTESIASGDVKRLLEMEHANVPAVSVALYRTPDNRFAAMQAYEYTDLEYRPLTALKVVGE